MTVEPLTKMEKLVLTLINLYEHWSMDYKSLGEEFERVMEEYLHG